jgi:plastocyanin
MATRIRLIIATAVLGTAVSCSGYSSPTMPGTNDNGTPVTIMRNGASSEFTPGSVTISAGASVTWTNNDTVAHTATSDSGAFNGSIAPGAKYSYTFPAKGTFPYHCSVHPGMTGTVVVQ